MEAQESTVEIHPTDRWQRIEKIFLAAADLPLEERPRYLREACGGDPELRREVESLLEADDTDEAPVGDVVRESVNSMVKHEFDGLSAGAWRLLDEIGRGGMGTVYRAKRTEGDFNIEVAIKILNRGIESPAILDRFRRERQMLARLEHPNIARLLDGGTTRTGHPYLVMEFVAGEPLTRYCDQRRLSIRDRVALFRKVCDAVSCAHRNLIIHRDLKPDNILVTADGTPKLLDFGIGKILDPTPGESELTSTAERVGTPSWCSPEQIRGENIGIGTDIYSLGVVLFRLLSGYRPYPVDTVTWENAITVICERDTLRASDQVVNRDRNPQELRTNAYNRATTPEHLRRQLAGDLDNILAFALRKEADRRYHSVDQFSDELQRYLEGRPVRAAGDTVFYLAGKFIRRHRLGVGTAAVLTTLLCISTLAALWQAQRLSTRLAEDRKLAGTFLSEIHGAVQRLPGSTPVREVLLTKSLDYLHGLAKDTGEDRETRRSLALAEEQFSSLLKDMLQFDKALVSWRIARDIREKLAAENPTDRQLQYELASSYLIGGYITGRAERADHMHEIHQKGLAIAERLVADYPGNRDYQVLAADACMNVAYSANVIGRPEDAAALLRRAVKIREGLKQAPTVEGRTEAQRSLATLHYRLGSIEAQNNRPTEALADLGKALAIQQQLASEREHDRELNSALAGTHHFLGYSLGQLGRNAEALGHFREAVNLREAAIAADPKDGATRTLLAGNYAEEGMVLAALGRTRDAVEALDRAIQLMRRAVSENPASIPMRLSLATDLGHLAEVYDTAKQFDSGLDSWKRALAIYDALAAEGKQLVPTARVAAEEAKARYRKDLELVLARRQ